VSTEVIETVTIARRFRGPPDSANGGYACGVVAARVSAGCTVRLHRPPPLDRPLEVRRSGGVSLYDGVDLIAEGAAALPGAEVPAPVSLETAAAAADRYRWSTEHPFPECFVCGPERHAHDGLRIFPGRVMDRDIVAAPWQPDRTVCDGGRVRQEVVWAALDCPSWFGILEFETDARVALLGQLTARVVRPPRLNEACVVIGWSRGRQGRKLYGGAALYTGAGELIGSSDALWIELKNER
jgi:hypothetical protein